MNITNPVQSFSSTIAPRRPLDVHFNLAVRHISFVAMDGYRRFVLTDNGSLCDTYEKICAYYKQHKRVLIWSGESDKSIFACKETNHYSRALHDLIHIKKGFDFSAQGEIDVCAESISLLRQAYPKEPNLDYWCKLMDCEIIGQVEYLTRNGHFVGNQMGFTKAYLSDKESALSDLSFLGLKA